MLSIDTRREMYNYLLSDRIKSIKNVDSNLQVYITEQIKELSKRLFYKTELYIGKSTLKRDNNYRIKRAKNYRARSNKLIYDVLQDLNICYDYIDEKDEKIIEEQLSKITYDKDNIDDIAETGSNDRKKLIRACKLFLQKKDFEFYAKDKYEEKYCIADDSWLCEQVLGKYSKKHYKSVMQSPFNPIKSIQPFASQLKPDIILWNTNSMFVLDVKVYSKILEKNQHGDLKYVGRDNRFQVNSYIGAVIVSGRKYSTKQYNQGIILHIVNKELYEESKEAHNTDLTIESNRPMKLWLIEDKGLDYIFDEYNRLIESII